MMNDSTVNVHNVQKAFTAWYSQQKQTSTNAANPKEVNGYDLFKRWEYYMVPRSLPDGTRPSPSAVAKTYLNYFKNRQKTTNRITGTSNWKYVGNVGVPANYGGDGRVNRLHFFPGNTNIIYACTPAGGLWKSTNGGNSWSSNTDQLADLAVGDIAINLLKPSIMYIGTGDNDAGGYLNPSTIGVLRSSDSGKTWNTTGMTYTLQSSGPAGNVVNKICFSPADTSWLYAATSFGLYYSRDDGTTWKKVLVDNVKSLEFEPYHANTVYAGTYAGRFYRSVDSGKSFKQIITGLPASGVGRIAIGVSNADSNYVYSLDVTSYTSAFYGIYLSKDRGQTFTAQATFAGGAPNLLGWSNTGSDSSGQAWYNLNIVVSPTNRDSIFVAGSWLWTSSDDGVTWSFSNGMYSGAHIDVHNILLYPGSSKAFLMACDGGVFQTPDAGNSWTDFSNNLEIAEQYCVGPSADDPTLWLSGWQDNGTSLSGKTWTSVYGGDGMTCFIDYGNDANLYASYEDGALAESPDKGVTWYNANNGITETGGWNTPWLQDPQNPSALFAGFKNVWESFDGGSTWGQISTWGTSTLVSLVVAPSNDMTIYAAQSNQIRVTTDGGGTWANITPGLPVSAASITAIAVDPNNPSRVWVSFSGWNASDKVFQSTNGGSSWANVTTGLPNFPVNCIIYQNGTPDGIYVGTDMGIYYRDNTTGGWIPYNNGLPNVQVYDLKLSPGNLLLAGTFGRGTWQSPTYVNVGMNELSFTNSVKVYPNPTHENIQVEFEGRTGQYDLTVTDVLGQTVFSEKVNSNGRIVKHIDVSAYSKGVYIVGISNGKDLKVEKKIIIY